MSGGPQVRSRRVVAAGSGAAGLALVVLLAVPFIKPLEGREFVPYPDIARVLTVCDGHTGPDIVRDKTYSPGECDTLLARDILAHARGIAACVHVDVPVESYVAFTSFTFNVGVRAFCRSTVARRLNAGDLAGACAHLMDWNKARIRGVLTVSRGLNNRRLQERAMCERGLS